MNKQFDQTWDLESIFPGGSESKEVRAALDELEATTSALSKEMASTKATAFINQLQPLVGLTKRLAEAGALKDQIEIFVGCLRFQDVDDVKALQLFGRVQQIGAELANPGHADTRFSC